MISMAQKPVKGREGGRKGRKPRQQPPGMRLVTGENKIKFTHGPWMQAKGGTGNGGKKAIE
jgi:hypothetical protein